MIDKDEAQNLLATTNGEIHALLHDSALQDRLGLLVVAQRLSNKRGLVEELKALLRFDFDSDEGEIEPEPDPENGSTWRRNTTHPFTGLDRLVTITYARRNLVTYLRTDGKVVNERKRVFLRQFTVVP